MFWMGRAGKGFRATGMLRRAAPGGRGTLEDRCSSLFAGIAAEEPPYIVGALPFHGDAPEFLFQPAFVERAAALPEPCSKGQGVSGNFGNRITEIPTADDYARIVRRALGRLAIGGTDGLRKVVLARRMLIECGEPVDVAGLLLELSRDPNVTTYSLDLDSLPEGGGHALIGATPELLVAREGMAVRSDPLAGSMPRAPDAAEDRRRAQKLLASDKDRREHAIVVEYVLDLLSPLCRQLDTPDGTTLRATDSMWHLGTAIEGVLKPGAPSAAGLAAILHPTPAVGGYPLKPALQAISELEQQDRGYYAGAVGFTDAAGDGEWYVALRCAELVGPNLTLHAGAGIVHGSDPEEEVAETAAKFRAMLGALGLAHYSAVNEGAMR